MRTIIILLSLLVVGLLTSCQQKKNKAALTDQKVEIAKPSSEKTVETISELEKTEKSVKQMNYYVVADCFEFKENAERLNQLLISKGFKSQILPFYNLNMVTYSGYETREEAQATLNQMVLQPGKEMLWVYPLKLSNISAYGAYIEISLCKIFCKKDELSL